MRLLAVEDEVELAALLKANLARHGFAADSAGSLSEAETCLKSAHYDAVLLDRRLPDGDGLQLLRSLRAAGNNVPVISITARDSIEDRVAGLNAGADDYIVKPFALEELVARINAVLRRPGGALGLMLAVDSITFNTATREVRIAGRDVVLPRRELAVLEMMMRAAGRVVTRDKILEGLYGFDDEPTSNAVDANISRLRRHLKEAGSDVQIQVIRGVGYLLRPEG